MCVYMFIYDTNVNIHIFPLETIPSSFIQYLRKHSGILIVRPLRTDYSFRICIGSGQNVRNPCKLCCHSQKKETLLLLIMYTPGSITLYFLIVCIMLCNHIVKI